MKLVYSLPLLILLAACNSGADGSGEDDTTTEIQVPDTPDTGDVPSGDDENTGDDDPVGDNDFDDDFEEEGDDDDGQGADTPTNTSWLRGYVESYDEDAVAEVHNIPGYSANDQAYEYRIDGHPEFSSWTLIRNNALTDAGLDYALSVGLTGKGQVVALMDDGVVATHEQFDGKTVTIDEAYDLNDADDYGKHGTSVASVIAGTGEAYGAMGFAPEADLFVGSMNYNNSVDWSEQAEFVLAAKDAGAIALNNSWSMTTDLSEWSSSDVFDYGDAKDYIAALREFAETGVIVFSMQNEYDSTNANLMAGIPLSYTDLEDNFITAINIIPEWEDGEIVSATRVSAACLETAAYCLAGNGQVRAAKSTGDDDYGLATGTSFVSPQIAGSIALLAEAFPDLTAEQLRVRLLATADNGWYETAGEVEFADGVVHGYNEEFGHGFLNLKDALLPIGTTEIPVASSSNNGSTRGLELGTAAISGGLLSGSAITTSLGNTSVIAVDALDGVFDVSGDALATGASKVDYSDYQLATMLYDNFSAGRNAKIEALKNEKYYRTDGDFLVSPDAFTLSGLSLSEMALNDRMRMELMNDEDGSIGLGMELNIDQPAGSVMLGMNVLHQKGAVMGMTVPGYEDKVSGKSMELKAGLARRISDVAGVRLEGALGVAEGDGAGMVSGFDDVVYDATRLSMDLVGLAGQDDVLTISASRPAGFSGGSANMILPVASHAGVTEFSSESIDIASSDRQVDLSIEYATNMSDSYELRAGVISSFNAGHVAGEKNTAAFLGVQKTF
jgi:hypothetical protein